MVLKYSYYGIHKPKNLLLSYKLREILLSICMNNHTKFE